MIYFKSPYIQHYNSIKLEEYLEPKIGEYYAKKIGNSYQKFLNIFINPLTSKISHKRFIKINKRDTFECSSEMAFFCYNLIKKMKKRGAPFVEDEDVPDNLKTSDTVSIYDIDENYFSRWTWVTNEILFALEATFDDSWEDQFHHGDPEIKFIKIENSEYYEMKNMNEDYWFDKAGKIEYYNRIQNGLRLFGKYFRSFWE